MLEVSEKYREMAESDAREVSVKVNIGDIELTNDDIIDLNIYRSMGESGFSIGGVVTTRIRLLALMKLPYSGEAAMDVSIGFGFDEENASEYVQLGRFYGCATNPSFDTTQVEIIGYDKLGSGSFLNRRFHGDFAPEFPCTVQEILDYICQRSNLECDFTGNNYSVSELPLKDSTRDDADYERYYTYKEILGFIAAAHGGVAAMNNENKLVFLSVGEETETVDSADCIDFAFKSADEFTVKGILLHVQDVLSTGSTNIFINDDSKIAYDGETTDGVVEASCPFGSIAMAEELWQQLGGFSYYSCEFTRRGRGWTELGDVMYANDSLSGRTLLKYEGKMIAQTVEWNFSASEGFVEHIISKAESPEESTDRLGSGNAINNGSGIGDNELIKGYTGIVEVITDVDTTNEETDYIRKYLSFKNGLLITVSDVSIEPDVKITNIFKEDEGLSEEYRYAYRASGPYGYVTIDDNYIYLSPVDVKNLLLMSDVTINASKVYIDVEVIQDVSAGSQTAAYVFLGTGYNESQLAWQPNAGITGGFANKIIVSTQQPKPNFPRQVISFDLSEVRGNPLCFSFVNVDCDMYVYNIWVGD